MKPKIFFSHGFRNNEKKTAEFFRRILAEEIGEENILTGEDLDNIGEGDSIDLIKKTLGNINKCKGVFAVFPKREKIEKNAGNSSYNTSTNVIFEVGYATGKNKKVFGFLEDGITKEEIGMNPFMTFLKSKNDQNWKIFKKSELVHRSIEEKLFRDLIKGAVENMEIKRAMPYTCLNALKETIVCNNGYGKIRYSYRYMMDCSKKEGSLLFEHVFRLDKSAKKGSKLPSFEEMKAQNPHKVDGNDNYFFSYEVIKGNKKSFNIIKPVLKKSDTELHFAVKIDGPFKENQVFEYEYAIGAPNLFSVYSSDLEKGKRVKDLSHVESDFCFPFAETESLVFVIKFEKGIEVSQEPYFIHYLPSIDPDLALPISEKEGFDKKRKGAYYTTYFKKGLSIDTRAGKLRAQWRPK